MNQMDNKQIVLAFIDTGINIAKRNYSIGLEIEKRGLGLVYFTYSKECANMYKSKGCNYIYLPDEFEKDKLTKPLIQYLKEFEDKYDIPSINLLISGDIDYQRMNKKKALIGLVKHFLFWERFLTNNQLDFIIGGIERFCNNVPYYVSKKHKTKYLCLGIAPLIDGSFVLNDNIFGHFDELIKYWNKNEHKKLNPLEYSVARRYINTIIKEKKGSYVGFAGEPQINKTNILLFFKRAYLNIFTEKFRNPYAPLFAITKKETLKAIRKHFEKIFYYKSKPEKYVYYPLHVQNDAQLIIRAPHYTNQLFLIEYIAKCIPIGYKLYVKCHPNNIGGTPLRMLRKIKKITNVVLISPRENSHDIIKNAAAITVVNSTVGLEGILHMKPVITFGNVFYNLSNLTFNVKDLYQLPEVIKNAVNSPPVKEEKLLKFINAYLKTSKQGHILFYKNTIEKASKKENLMKVAEEIIKRIKEYG